MAPQSGQECQSVSGVVSRLGRKGILLRTRLNQLMAASD